MRNVPIVLALLAFGVPSGAEAQNGTPLACRTDADCPTPSCGPCTPGAPLTREDMRMSCVVSPCLNKRTVCATEGDARGHCVMGPGVSPDPRVFRVPTPR